MGPAHPARGVIASRLVNFQPEMGATEFRLDDVRRCVVSRGGKEAVIEAIYSFAQCTGAWGFSIQDPADGGKLKAWTLSRHLTLLQDMKRRLALTAQRRGLFTRF